MQAPPRFQPERSQAGTIERVRVTDEHVTRLVLNSLLALLPLPIRIDTQRRSIFTLLIHACATATSLHQTLDDLDHTPSLRSVLYHLHKISLRQLEARANQLLQAHIRSFLPKVAKLAVDLTLLPYHGQPHETKREISRGQAKNGTTRFHGYATLYLILWGRRFTLAVRYVRHKEPLTHTLDQLLKQAALLGITPKLLLADKQFYTAKVLEFLKHRNIPFLIPVRCSRNFRYFKGRRSYATPYAVTGVPVTLVISVRYARGKYGRHGIEYFAYVTWGTSLKPSRVFEEYRARFGIESSYKLLHSARARTSSRDPALRFLFVVVGFMLQNAWVVVQWETLRKPGWRVTSEVEFPFKRFLRWVVRTVARFWGELLSFTVERERARRVGGRAPIPAG